MIDTVGLVWLASSIAGAALAGYGIRDGQIDLHALGDDNNGRRIIARGYIRSQTIRLVISIGWFAIGLPVVLDGRITPLNGFTFILVATNALLAAAAWLDLLDRRRLRKGTSRNG